MEFPRPNPQTEFYNGVDAGTKIATSLLSHPDRERATGILWGMEKGAAEKATDLTAEDWVRFHAMGLAQGIRNVLKANGIKGGIEAGIYGGNSVSRFFRRMFQ